LFIRSNFHTRYRFVVHERKRTDIKQKPVPIGVPTNLSVTSNSPQAIRVEWQRVDSVDGYQICVGDTTQLVSTPNTWYTFSVGLNSGLQYGTQYAWQVRAVRGTATGKWAAATLTTVALPDLYKYIGTWETDSVSLNASMAGNLFPVENLLPNGTGGLPTQDVTISIESNPDNANAVYFTIDGIDAYMPVGQASLNKVLMQTGSNGSMIKGSVTINYAYTYTFDTPLALNTLPNYDQIKQQAGTLGSLLDGTAIESVTVTVKDVNVTGQLNATNSNKAVYTIQTDAPVNVKTTNALLDVLVNNFYFSNNPLKIEFDVYSTKK